MEAFEALRAEAALAPSLETRRLLFRFVSQLEWVRGPEGRESPLARAGWGLEARRLVEIACWIESLGPALDAWRPSPFEGDLARAVPVAAVSGKSPRASPVEAAFAAGERQRVFPGRFTIGGPEGFAALYACSDPETAGRESEGQGERIVAVARARFERLLDLTDDRAVREGLGVGADSLREELDSARDAYDLPQTLGALAANRRFDAIRFQSAKGEGVSWAVFAPFAGRRSDLFSRKAPRSESRARQAASPK